MLAVDASQHNPDDLFEQASNRWCFFWINGDGQYPVPRESYYMAGAGGQTTMIVPSHDLVVVRMGYYKGETPGAAALRKALTLLVEAVPRHN